MKAQRALFVDVSADGLFLIGHLSAYVKVIITTDPSDSSSILSAAITDANARDHSAQTSTAEGAPSEASAQDAPDEREEEVEEHRTEEKEKNTTFSSKSSLETRKTNVSRATEQVNSASGQTTTSMQMSASPELEDETADVTTGNDARWHELVSKGLIGTWLSVDIIAASRYFVFGVRSKA